MTREDPAGMTPVEDAARRFVESEDELARAQLALAAAEASRRRALEHLRVAQRLAAA